VGCCFRQSLRREVTRLRAPVDHSRASVQGRWSRFGGAWQAWQASVSRAFREEGL
jgi:hypothetical protein